MRPVRTSRVIVTTADRRLPPPVGGPAFYSTNFSAAENPVNQGGVWKHTSTNWAKVKTVNKSGDYVAVGTQDGNGSGGGDIYDDSYAYIDPAYKTFSPNQKVTITIWKGSPDTQALHEVECLLRVSDTSSTIQCYEALIPYDGGYSVQVVRWNGPRGGGEGTQYTYIGDTGANIYTPINGDTFEFEINGTTAIVRLNGTPILNKTITTDANGTATWTINSGQPGMGFFTNAVDDNEYGTTSYTATDI